MKKLFTLVAALLYATASFAQQIPNSGFETWQTKTGTGLTGPYTYQMPQNWEIGFITEIISSLGLPPNIDKSTTNAGNGNSSLKLSAVAMPGMGVIGSDIATTFALGPNKKPDALTGSFRTSSAVTNPDDYGHAMVFATKWNGTSRDTIGAGGVTLETSPNGFTQFNAPIQYMNNDVPDSTIVYFLYFPENGNQHLLIDNLNLLFQVSGTKENTAKAQLKLSPNPVTDNARVTFQTTKAGNGTITIRDLTGKEIKQQPISNITPGANAILLETKELKKGIYTATLQTANSLETLRFIKN